MNNKSQNRKGDIQEFKEKKEIRKERWTSPETNKLLKYVKDVGHKWTFISKKMTNRSAKQCMLKYYNTVENDTRQNWSYEEDKILIEWVKSFKNKNIKWKKCADLLESRSEKQCKERWVNYLNPEVKKGKWNVEEHVRYIKFLFIKGCDWHFISKGLRSRPENLVKNYFYCSIRILRNSSFMFVLKLFCLKNDQPLEGK
jgi:hypothetical protein